MRQANLRKNGFILPFIVYAMVLLLTAGMGLLYLSLRSRVLAIRDTSRMVARCAADAGITKALYEMNKKLKAAPWSGSSLPEAAGQTLPNSNATFSYNITGTSPDNYQIKSTGTYNSVVKVITCSLKLQGLFDAAILADTQLTLTNAADINWYNNDADDFPMQVGTNSTAAGAITLMNSSLISGDAVVGVDGDPATAINAGWGNITGDRYAQTEQCRMQSFAIPAEMEYLPYGGRITSTQTITSSGKYNGIDLKHKETVTFLGDMTIYITGDVQDVELSQSAKIVIDGNVTMYIKGSLLLNNASQLEIVDPAVNPNASLKLYVGDTIQTQNLSSINNKTEDPHKMQIYGLDTCKAIDLSNAGTLYGTIYAPTADVTFNNLHAAYGSVVADTFAQINNSAFWYDASLRNASISDEGVEFAIKRWCEI